MGSSTAEDVWQTFLADISDLHQSKILKAVPDGPKVDLLFLKFLTEWQEEKEMLLFLDNGRCRLPLNSFKLGVKKKRLELLRLLNTM